jgi:hypothetical protein
VSILARQHETASGKTAIVARGDLPPPLDPAFDTRQFQRQDRGLHLVEPRIVAMALGIILRFHAIEAEAARQLEDCLVVAQHHAAITIGT